MNIYTDEPDGFIPFMQIILGVGMGRVPIERFKRNISLQFLDSVFTKNEFKLLHNVEVAPKLVACTFVAKAAVSRALGTGFRGFTPRDVEILPGEGKPVITLYGGAQDRFSYIGGARFHLSINCDDHTATAMAVLEGGQ